MTQVGIGIHKSKQIQSTDQKLDYPPYAYLFHSPIDNLQLFNKNSINKADGRCFAWTRLKIHQPTLKQDLKAQGAAH